MTRHITIRHQTTIAQRLPEANEEKLSFQKYVLKLRKQHEYLLGQIGNADQTTLFFDKPEQVTLLANEQCRLELWKQRNAAP
jgi:hypothetical protein